jgi:hypothetical protein
MPTSAPQIGRNRPLPETDYTKLFQINLPDISRSDNESLARSARDISQTMITLLNSFEKPSPSLTRLILREFFRFAGSPQSDDTLTAILSETGAAVPVALTPRTGDTNASPRTGVPNGTPDSNGSPLLSANRQSRTANNWISSRFCLRLEQDSAGEWFLGCTQSH